MAACCCCWCLPVKKERETLSRHCHTWFISKRFRVGNANICELKCKQRWLTSPSPLGQGARSLSRLPFVALGHFVHIWLLPRHLLHKHLRTTNTGREWAAATDTKCQHTEKKHRRGVWVLCNSTSMRWVTCGSPPGVRWWGFWVLGCPEEVVLCPSGPVWSRPTVAMTTAPPAGWRC